MNFSSFVALDLVSGSLVVNWLHMVTVFFSPCAASSADALPTIVLVVDSPLSLSLSLSLSPSLTPFQNNNLTWGRSPVPVD